MKSIKRILSNFLVAGEFVDGNPFGSGHINDTFLVEFKDDKSVNKYILRKINSYVFNNPQLIIENTISVTNHIRKKLLQEHKNEINKRVLSLIGTINGQHFFIDEIGEYWCLLNFIEDAYSINSVDTPEQAFEAARTYGEFQKHLLDFDVEKCHVTIKDFHNLENRIRSFKEAVKSDIAGRLKDIRETINNLEKYEYINNRYLDLKNYDLPLRITHNDTKINNIMLCEKTDRGLCVVDLDTVMPGIILNDFGDMVRTFTSPAFEDEKDIIKVTMRISIFEALVKGYLSELNHYLTIDEKNNLVLGAKIIVYEQTVRFLTDYLNGDQYYKIEYDKHNLNRARNQLALLESIELQTSDMAAIVEKYS